MAFFDYQSNLLGPIVLPRVHFLRFVITEPLPLVLLHFVQQIAPRIHHLVFNEHYLRQEMSCASSRSIPNFDARIRTKDGKKFRISYYDLVHHILLLRRVIAQPELTQEGPTLDYFINDYCNRMA
ncbi:unnamed protein product [Rotaria sordida]|nr:unnamed protein product [Rotaria sordida]